MIPTKTRLQYANGYLELGMINEASEEIESIMGEDRMSLAVELGVPIHQDLYGIQLETDWTLTIGWQLAGK